ncbi:hypothetical protein A0H81_01739 [Grifola frondosa]|uniref:Uncharacterized protein n=1 Tax=Grifola frondosa TaxID=5627 RepID=A0A1C7MNV5_GRIFR|nr:hypothetical protein A0H81_01739 [Grifola frondosa]
MWTFLQCVRSELLTACYPRAQTPKAPGLADIDALDIDPPSTLTRLCLNDSFDHAASISVIRRIGYCWNHVRTIGISRHAQAFDGGLAIGRVLIS